MTAVLSPHGGYADSTACDSLRRRHSTALTAASSTGIDASAVLLQIRCCWSTRARSLLQGLMRRTAVSTRYGRQDEERVVEYADGVGCICAAWKSIANCRASVSVVCAALKR